MNIDYKSIGNRIKKARNQMGINQETLAELAGISPSHMSNIEKGTTKVSLSVIVGLANVLSVTVDDLLCDNLLQARPSFEKNIQSLIGDCDNLEIRMLEDIAVAIINTTRRHSSLTHRTNQTHYSD